MRLEPEHKTAAFPQPKSGRFGRFAGQLMGWSGRAPAPPAREAGKRRQRREPKHWECYGLRSWIEAAKKRLHGNVVATARSLTSSQAWLGASGSRSNLRG